MLRVATLNVNGIRASLRKGLDAWIQQCNPDFLCLQEIRARPTDLGTWQSGPAGWHTFWHPAQRPGYAGVALLTKHKPTRVTTVFGEPHFDHEGRWLRADFGDLVIISLYLPSGSSSNKRQQIKFACLDLLYQQLRNLRKSGKEFIIAGDINIAHTKLDIKNWKGNLNNSGFLPEERRWFDDICYKLGWVDVFRLLDDSAGRYTWWSQRGGARTRNVGWRIDYQLATPTIAATARAARIDMNPVLSDHAPVVIDYNWTGNFRPGTRAPRR